MDDPRQQRYVQILLALMIGGCTLALIYLLIWGYAARGAWSLGPMGLS